MAYFIFFSLVLTLISQLGFSSCELSPSVDLVPGETAWSNNKDSNLATVRFYDGSLARFIVLSKITLRNDSGFGYGLCFYCTSSKGNSCYLSVLFVEIFSDMILRSNELAVWSSNRDKPVGENATLEFDYSGNLVLEDVAEGGSIWSTATSGSPVSKMTITPDGNLLLMDSNGVRFWQSHMHLIDTLLNGQVIRKGQKLTSRAGLNDLSSGLFSVIIDSTWLSFDAKTDENVTRYLSFEPNSSEIAGRVLESVEFRNGNLSFNYSGLIVSVTDIKNFSDVQIMRLDSDGGLRIHGWRFGKGWGKVRVFLPEGQDECQLPLKCGTYGLCRNGSSCSCPVSAGQVNHFKLKDKQNQEQGCIDEQGTSGKLQYELQKFWHISYFSYYDRSQAVPGLEDEHSCVKACLNDQSCMAAFFLNDSLVQKGFCFVTSKVLSLKEVADQNYSSTHMRVVQSSAPVRKTKKAISSFVLIIVACFASLLVALVLVAFCAWIWQKKKLGNEDWYEHSFWKPEIAVKRFSHQELYISTSRFSERLGRGGFGSVFKGVLVDGRAIAVKKLETKQGAKEFLAEIETLGNLHHINLVRLFGFCLDRKNRMLVYEYMSKGSLDKWIFSRNKAIPWSVREKIILDVAKGLAYLHEECRHKIAHLDVKPHNILIDDNFNAKLSDFGMSKLISRDESQVMTGARGTLGYLAPEWQNSVITVKADVYSFGIVVLEIVCGRRVLDHSQPDSDVQLRTVLGNKAREGKLKEMVDHRMEEMRAESKCEEAVEMIKLGMWCSEDDYHKRPSMSRIVKILEGGFKNQS